MTKKNPIVQDYMTRLPFEMQIHEPLSEAAELMREKGFRHIPVFNGSKIFGVLSDRDVKFALAILGVEAKNLKVEEVATTDCYEVSPLHDLREVAGQMAEKKIGSALVMDANTLVGIITSIDLLKAFSQI